MRYSAELVAKYAIKIETLLTKIAESQNVVFEFSDQVVAEVAYYFLRDLDRIDIDQNEDISTTKFAGYLAFWIRKLRPIQIVRADKGAAISREQITAINETISLEIAVRLIQSFKKHQNIANFTDDVRLACPHECDGPPCFTRYAERFFSYLDEINKKYMTYSMRHRTFGPHHICTVLDHLIFAACDFTRGDRNAPEADS